MSAHALERVVERLVAAGLNPAEANRQADLFDAASGTLAALGAGAATPEWIGTGAGSEPMGWYVPGRIELLGKHTDYAGGRSLLCASERGLAIAASPRRDGVLRVVDLQGGAGSGGSVEVDLTQINLRDDPRLSGWRTYPRAVAHRVARNFGGPLRGADVAVASDLPRSAGLSSSSALITGLFAVLSAVNELDRRREYVSNIGTLEDLAGYLGSVENGRSFGTLDGDAGVGTFGGSEDHTAILCCRPGMLSQYRFCPVQPERTVSLPHDWTFAIGVSGVAADKAGGARDQFNRASRAAAAVLERWRAATGRQDPTLHAAATSAADAPARIRKVLQKSESAELLGRFEQFLEESEHLIPDAAAAVERGDRTRLGTLVDRSQRLAESFLGNQTPETVALAWTARELGAMAASAFGAGFGGSVWALVEEVDADDLLERWAAAYRRRFPEAAESSAFFLSGAGPGLMRIK